MNNGKHDCIKKYSRVHKKANDLRIHYLEKGNFVSTFWVNNTPIYMSSCSFLVKGGPLDSGSCPSVVMIVMCSQPSVVIVAIVWTLLIFLLKLFYSVRNG